MVQNEEGLADPLLHMVRNSVDHGVEIRADCEAAGMPTLGTIRLSASHVRGNILVELADDGMCWALFPLTPASQLCQGEHVKTPASPFKFLAGGQKAPKQFSSSSMPCAASILSTTGPLVFLRRARLIIAALTAGFCYLVSTAHADWTHYRGPTSNGVSAEKLPALIPKDGPRLLWKESVGTGASSVTVSGDRAFTMGNVDNKDVVWCLDAKSGSVLWKHEYAVDMDKRMFEGGTAATPTVDGNRVYSVSHLGDLYCLDAATGKVVWYKHFVKDFGGKPPKWGFAGSPAVEGNLVLVDVGGAGSSTVALDKATGATVWKSGDDEAGYASPIVATIAGKKTVVVFKATDFVGLDLKDGKELWRCPWKTSYNVNAATPLVIGDKIFISSGYGAGCALFEVKGPSVLELWKNKNLKSHMNSPTVFQSAVFGVDGQGGATAPLTCLDLASGAVKWQEKSVNGGALVVADGKLICLTEKGELVICEASAVGFKPISRTQVLGKRNWVQPTFANGRIFCRNNDGDLVALELR